MRIPTRLPIMLACLSLPLATLAPAAAAPGDVKVSDRTYVRYDGGTDATLADCGTNNRQQNEPAASVAPHDPNLMTAGANDYCPVGTIGSVWTGLYYSADGGSSWTNSLVPGYPGDSSPAAQASPLSRLGLTNAGDPVQAWDNNGHLFYGGIAFNRSAPASGSIWVARYAWNAGPAPTYEFTSLVARGTPSPIFRGLFHDKVQLEVDRGATSPHAGNVYVCWARFTGGPNNGVFLSRSTDGGVTFSSPSKISEGVQGSQFCDIAVTSGGDVHVGWRQYESANGQAPNAAMVAKSTDGGRAFGKPKIVAPFLGWDPLDSSVDAAAYGQATYAACLVADATPGTCASPEPRATVRNCGDGPLACRSGYVFFRAGSQIRVTADPSGDTGDVFLTFDASVRGTEVSTGTTYGTAGLGVGSQAAVYLVRTSDGGATWSAPARIDAQSKGHQFFPDISADSGLLHAVWQDSRDDTATGLTGDWRTVPISNMAVAANPPGAVSAGPGVHTFYALSGDDGLTWTVQRVSTVPQMPQYEQFGDRDSVFFGDYNYIAASGTTALMTWTDQRDTISGTDPRYTDGDGTDGFDVLQCRAPDGIDTCPTAGGLDQNIYGKVVP